MAQASRPAADHIVSYPNSDAGPYSADQWAELLALAHVGDPDTASERAQLRGVIPTAWNHLVVTTTGGVNIRVASGAAWVNGHIFVHDPTVAPAAPLDFTPSTPAGAGDFRIDKIVVVVNNTNTAYNTNLEFPADLTDYAGVAFVPGYSCRLALLTGIVNGAARALVQTADYWMIELARYTITNTPPVALTSGPTDYRTYAQIEHIIGATDVDGMADALIIGTELDNGTALAGLGTSIAAQLDDAGGTLQGAGRLAWRWHTPTAAAEVSQIELRTEYITSEVLSGVIVAPLVASADGNARGTGAVDLQGSRALVTQVASGAYSFVAGGMGNTASGDYAHVEGFVSTASGDYSHAEGASTASADYTHAEGSNTTASALGAHAEGVSTVASGIGAHAEGSNNTASGDAAHAGGSNTTADGDYSLAAGRRADTNSFDGVFIWADSENAAFAADRANQFKVRASGGTHLVQNNNAAALPALRIEQIDQDKSFIDFVGTSAADQTKSISTVNGDGAVTGPKNFSAAPGWAFVGMVRIEINGVEFWLPYYTPDTA